MLEHLDEPENPARVLEDPLQGEAVVTLEPLREKLSPMNAEVFRHMPYGEAEPQAKAVQTDGDGEVLVLVGSGEYYALYYLYGLPDWVEDPKHHPEDFRPPYQMAHWLEENGFQAVSRAFMASAAGLPGCSG